MMPLQGCKRLSHFLFCHFKPVFALNRRRATPTNRRESVQTLDKSLQWHHILLSCFSLILSDAESALRLCDSAAFHAHFLFTSRALLARFLSLVRFANARRKSIRVTDAARQIYGGKGRPNGAQGLRRFSCKIQNGPKLSNAQSPAFKFRFVFFPFKSCVISAVC